MQPEMTSGACHITGGYKLAKRGMDEIPYIQMPCCFSFFDFDRHPREGGDDGLPPSRLSP
jgi:hypothetical protein